MTSSQASIASAPPSSKFKNSTYHPDPLPVEYLNRWCEGGQWVRLRRRLAYCEAQKALRQEMPEPATVEFFEKYNFHQFTYDPSEPTDVEFKRLCEQRRWGPAKLSKVQKEYDIAQQKSALWKQQQCEPFASSAVVEFFQNHKFDNFTYDTSAEPIEELRRLQTEQEKVQIAKAELFNTETKSQAAGSPGASPPPDPLLGHVGDLPAVEFLKAQRVKGYNYSSGLLHEEFMNLLSAKKAEWEARHPKPKANRAVEEKARKKEWEKEWKKIEAELKKRFQFAVEKEFDSLVVFIRRSTGLKAWEVMVELYGVGKEAVIKEEAEKALESVSVNIYDFIGAIKEVFCVLTKESRGFLIPLLAPHVQILKLRGDRMLSFYSRYTCRVFSRNNATKDGTVMLLLRRISQYWGSFDAQKARFESEAGPALSQVGNPGPHRIRELLLSQRWSFLGE
ncbi:hypothetical protein L873DRAFT_1846710 [Choiromyces venosus 120613-1]|uniref:Uncharacterized protein n=1 Tax=Choiromyces venosus 120613-1 TaxID=1336337 RepID=A0A3N4JBC2_9PEZI|nr:hypothetical protein L873DRAFT_1846710 [Choiromyces venosus 120613-1]